MRYGAGLALQEAVFDQLSTDPTLLTLVTGVYDALPAGPVPQRYVQLGPEQVRPRDDKTGQGARHDFTVLVVGQDAGFAKVKEAAVRVSDLLAGADLPLGRGQLVGIWFRQAKALRDRSDDTRRIDLRFVAQVYDI